MSAGSTEFTSYDAARAREDETGIKHEWADGVAFEMPGGTIRHSRVASNIQRELAISLRGSDCLEYNSDLRIRSLATHAMTYADVVVICGPVQTHPEDPTAATNPTVVVEVLSASTEARDRGEKLQHYMSLASVRHLLLVSTEAARVEHYQRTDLGWLYTSIERGAVSLDAIGVSLSLDEVYKDRP